jgi:hypothetical protein
LPGSQLSMHCSSSSSRCVRCPAHTGHVALLSKHTHMCVYVSYDTSR